MKKKVSRKWVIIILIVVILLSGWWIWNNRQCNLEKITFDINEIEKVPLDYEFCIPYEDRYLQEIKRIDPEIECYHGSSGRIGCIDSEYLCIGNTGHKDFRNILCKLSILDYIDRIDQTFWE
jgi:hypothetical protein